MARYMATMESSWAPAEVVAYMAVFSNAAVWDPGVARAERLDRGPVQVGSTFRLMVRFGFGTLPLTYEVVDLEPLHRVVLVADSGRIRSEDTISVVPRAGGSLVTYDAALTMHGLAALADPLLGLAFRRIGDRAIASLTRVLEGPPPASSAGLDQGVEAPTS